MRRDSIGLTASDFSTLVGGVSTTYNPFKISEFRRSCCTGPWGLFRQEGSEFRSANYAWILFWHRRFLFWGWRSAAS